MVLKADKVKEVCKKIFDIDKDGEITVQEVLTVASRLEGLVHELFGDDE